MSLVPEDEIVPSAADGERPVTVQDRLVRCLVHDCSIHVECGDEADSDRRGRARREPWAGFLASMGIKRQRADTGNAVGVQPDASINGASSLRDCYRRQEVAHPERAAFAARRDAKAFRSTV